MIRVEDLPEHAKGGRPNMVKAAVAERHVFVPRARLSHARTNDELNNTAPVIIVPRHAVCKRRNPEYCPQDGQYPIKVVVHELLDSEEGVCSSQDGEDV